MSNKNINKWAQELEYDDQPHSDVITSDERPDYDNVRGPYFAVVSFKRVTGSSYRPYTAGSKAWRKQANQQLADRAQSNFARNHR